MMQLSQRESGFKSVSMSHEATTQQARHALTREPKGDSHLPIDDQT